uniref:serine/threonine-protein kinase STY46-like n=1 Tax=Erigeron canadensis TaxID=72917 RepID=UPI001CB9744A|nr:serine/threonine-protein kinase STY46-like [Erigeron canadensis]
MEKSKKAPSAEELLSKIQDLEARHACIKQEISKVLVSSTSNRRTKPTNSSSRPRVSGPRRVGALSSFETEKNMEITQGGGVLLEEPLTETQYLNVMHSMGQAIHIFDLKYRIHFWNRSAERIYRLTAAEVFGKTPTEILVDPKDAALANYLLERTVNGESWSGEFPVTNKWGETFVVLCTNTPFRDENERLIGGICISSDSRPFRKMIMTPTGLNPRTRIDSQQPRPQTSIASKISNLASKVKLKMKKIDYGGGTSSEVDDDDALQTIISTPREHLGLSSPHGVFISTGTTTTTDDDQSTESSSKKKPAAAGLYKILSSKPEEWMAKKRISSSSVWPWNVTINNEREEVVSLDAKLGYFGWHCLSSSCVNNHQLADDEQPHIINSCASETTTNNYIGHEEEASSSSSSSGLWLSSTVRNVKVEKETDDPGIADYEILWQDLIIKGQIGQGSCGTVYHGLWHGSDVAIKLFMYQEFSDDVIISFKQEVSLMKRLRHPNILLFMGAVTSRQHMCIVTEFLPRGSLSHILQRHSTRLDWRRRIHMAMDIARGMNYLHRYKPPIVHRDLKSSNLLVDKNWCVKVGDFGLSRIKHQTYLQTKSGKGTPQWMAPEIIRNELPANEKSDVYSYGVVLWEIVTGKIPWDDLNPMQVIAAVGFMKKKLETPEDMDTLWASLIESCWCSEPESRPTFQDILYKLKELQKKYVSERKR